MERRDFLKKASAGSVGLALARPLGAFAKDKGRKPPNILFILVDEMRFPTVFPTGVNSVGEFLARFMPNTHSLWQNGVKFGEHYTAGTACTPSRSVMVSGLYTQQTWVCQTLKGGPGTKVSIPPILSPAFPTYGKLLREAGYDTPYIGKWHVSLMQLQNPLEPYGFDGMITPDPTAANLQGTVGDAANGYFNDQDIATTAVDWLAQRKSGDAPWCLSVCFQNPHDHEFFWAGSEFQTFNDLFNAQTTYQPFTFYSSNNNIDYPPVVSWDDDTLKDPPSYGYPALPPNWESAAGLAQNKPSTVTFLRTFSGFVWGAASDDPSQDQFTIQPYPTLDGYGIGTAPFSYWRRSLDSYTQILSIVDERIGEVLDAIPKHVLEDTVIVFTSDHGDYVGAHGLLSNKAATGYDEAIHVPLIVYDATGRFTGDIDTVRDNLTSSADLFNLFVSLGHNGSQSWLSGRYGKLYGGRHNMIPMLRSASAAGRDFVLLATDELIQGQYDFNDAPLHVVALRTKTEKLVTYSRWRSFSTTIIPSSIELEFYDYSTAGGRAEVDNTPDDPRVAPLLENLRQNIIPNELRAPLHGPYGAIQAQARQQYLQFAYLIENPPPGDSDPKIVKDWLGIGLNV